MEQSKFSFKLIPTNSAIPLGFEAWINDQCVFDTDHVTEAMSVSGDLPDDSVTTEHTLKMVLKYKTPEHTKISESGEILDDACLEISELSFDNINLGQLVNDLTVYEHDFNGTSTIIEDRFYGTMGCNGTVELRFTTPIYLWLLENM